MKGTLQILGSGSSMGVPRIGCKCHVCASVHPRNKRLRPSLLLKGNGKTILIDATPDFRYQALKNNITHLDGVIITHTHYDHVGGLDELRVYNFCQNGPIACLLSKDSYEELLVRYSYLFLKNSYDENSFHVEMDATKLEEEGGKTLFLDVPIQYMSHKQGKMKVTAYRFGDTAYVSDIGHYDKKMLKALEGIKQLIISTPHKERTKMHISLDEALNIAQELQVEKAVLTHLCHDMEYVSLAQELPNWVEVGYDGMIINFAID